MIEAEYTDFLLGLLKEHKETAPKYSDLAAVPFPNAPETEELRKQIEEIVSPNGGRPDALSAFTGAYEYWAGVDRTQLSGRDRFFRLKVLLSVLDQFCSLRPIHLFEGNDGQVLVGHRWWSVRNRYAGSPGFLDKGHLTESYAFPHLRVVRIREDEWYRGLAIRSAFRQSRFASGASRQQDLVLRIGLCAFSGNAKTTFVGTKVMDAKTGIHGFLAKSVGWWPDGCDAPSPDDYHQELRRAVEWAVRKKIHILLMPELSVCEKGREVVREAIEKEPGDLCLVIPGSFHVPSGEAPNELCNGAPIWLVKDSGIDDTTIPMYEKYERFSVSGSRLSSLVNAEDAYKKATDANCGRLQEDVRSSQSLRFLSTPLGVVGILICKDLLFLDKGALRECGDIADHLLVVSMNDTPGFFLEAAMPQAHFGSAIWYVNAAQMVSKPTVELAFWQIPRGAEGIEREKIILRRLQDSEQDDATAPEDGLIEVPGIELSWQMFAK